jgi:hypothetical protein
MSVVGLDALLALQDLDTAIDQRRHRRAHLPERAGLADIDGEMTRRGRVPASSPPSVTTSRRARPPPKPTWRPMKLGRPQ